MEHQEEVRWWRIKNLQLFLIFFICPIISIFPNISNEIKSKATVTHTQRHMSSSNTIYLWSFSLQFSTRLADMFHISSLIIIMEEPLEFVGQGVVVEQIFSQSLLSMTTCSMKQPLFEMLVLWHLNNYYKSIPWHVSCASQYQLVFIYYTTN